MKTKLLNFYTISATCMFLYILWFVHFVHWFTSGKSNYPHSCGAANAGLLVLTLAGIACSLILLIILCIVLKDKRAYIMSLLGLVLLVPAIVVAILS